MDSADAVIVGGLALCIGVLVGIAIWRLPPKSRRVAVVVAVVLVIGLVVLVLALDSAKETSEL